VGTPDSEDRATRHPFSSTPRLRSGGGHFARKPDANSDGRQFESQPPELDATENRNVTRILNQADMARMRYRFDMLGRPLGQEPQRCPADLTQAGVHGHRRTPRFRAADINESKMWCTEDRIQRKRCPYEGDRVRDEAAGYGWDDAVGAARPEPAIKRRRVQVRASGFVATELAWPSTWTDRLDRTNTVDPATS